MSTQKLPTLTVRAVGRAAPGDGLFLIPRVMASMTAIPVAALRKFCTARPTICENQLALASPEYACQFVFVMKLTAVFRARCHDMLSIPAGFSGSHFCVMSTTQTKRNPRAFSARSAPRYCPALIPVSGRTPVTR